MFCTLTSDHVIHLRLCFSPNVQRSSMWQGSDPIHWPPVSQLPNTYCVLSWGKSIKSIELHCFYQELFVRQDVTSGWWIHKTKWSAARVYKISKMTWKHNMGFNWQMHPFALPKLHYVWLALNSSCIRSGSDDHI